VESAFDVLRAPGKRDCRPKSSRLLPAIVRVVSKLNVETNIDRE
jgi:hypothetical protein